MLSADCLLLHGQDAGAGADNIRAGAHRISSTSCSTKPYNTSQPSLGAFYWSMCCVLVAASCIHPFVLFKLIRSVPARVLASISSSSKHLPSQTGADEAPKTNESEGKSSFMRLLSLSRSDMGIVVCGFISLCVAAATGTFIPHYTGVIIDCIVSNSSDFKVNMLMLLAVCAAQAVFTGGRGFCMSIAIARLKVRLQEMLFRSIVMQEQAFFDTSSTGELVSRLSSDTTKVGDMVSLNINIFLRSFIAAVGSLAFMFSLSWRLTIVTFSILPATIILSQVYGKWIQALSERAQTRMADCNKKAKPNAPLSLFIVSCMFSCRLKAAFRLSQLCAPLPQNRRRRTRAQHVIMCMNSFVSVLFYCRYCVALSEYYLESMREAKGYGL